MRLDRVLESCLNECSRFGNTVVSYGGLRCSILQLLAHELPFREAQPPLNTTLAPFNTS